MILSVSSEYIMPLVGKLTLKFFLSLSDVTVSQSPLSIVLRDLQSHGLPFSSRTSIEETTAKDSSDVDQSHDSGADRSEPVLGAGCAELYPEVERPSNPHLDESANITSSSSSGLKDITRPGTPMPGRSSRKSSSHDPESHDITEILQCSLGPGEDQLSDTEMARDGSVSLSRTRFVWLIDHILICSEGFNHSAYGHKKTLNSQKFSRKINERNGTTYVSCRNFQEPIYNTEFHERILRRAWKEGLVGEK